MRIADKINLGRVRAGEVAEVLYQGNVVEVNHLRRPIGWIVKRPESFIDLASMINFIMNNFELTKAQRVSLSHIVKGNGDNGAETI